MCFIIKLNVSCTIQRLTAQLSVALTGMLRSALSLCTCSSTEACTGVLPRQTCDLNLLDKRSVLACPARRDALCAEGSMCRLPFLWLHRDEGKPTKGGGKRLGDWGESKRSRQRDSEWVQGHVFKSYCVCCYGWPGGSVNLKGSLLSRGAALPGQEPPTNLQMYPHAHCNTCDCKHT